MRNEEQTMIDQFNLTHPVGAPIKFRNEKGGIEEKPIRAAAEFSRSADPFYKGVPCVYVKGRYDAIHLKDVIQ